MSSLLYIFEVIILVKIHDKVNSVFSSKTYRVVSACVKAIQKIRDILKQ